MKFDMISEKLIPTNEAENQELVINQFGGYSSTRKNYLMKDGIAFHCGINIKKQTK